MDSIWFDLAVSAVLALVVVLNVLQLAGALDWVERKGSALIQDRIGANRAAIFGFTGAGLVNTLMADPLKFLTKEDLVPKGVDRLLHTLSPCIHLFPALVAFAVIPFGPPVSLFGRQVSLYITDINVGLLYIVSVASIGVYGIILAGWASNSKYPLLASLRASAQLISYEVAVTMTLVSVIVTAGSLSMVQIVEAQRSAGVWFGFIQPVAFLIFFIGGLAETNRAPFDLPEAEQELTGGFHTEYSGIRFAFFMVSEYAIMLLVSVLAVILFFGGWNGVLIPLPPILWFVLKVAFFIYLFMWFRFTFPRYRYDQLMAIGWKVLLPLSLVNIIITGFVFL